MKTFLKTMTYGAVEVCTAGRGVRRVVNGIPFRFPARYARFYPPDYEPAKFAFLRAHCAEGDVALDIGAHIGLFSVLLARSVGASGRVYCFEPTPGTREILRRTLRLNGCEGNVEVRAEAVSSAPGSAVFYDTGDPASNANSLVPGRRSRGEVPVETLTVDAFVASRELRVRCLKIDVEGAEWDVLSGAAETIRRCRPALVLELHPEALARSGHSMEEVCALLDQYALAPWLDGRPIAYDWLRGQRDLIEVQLLPSEQGTPTGPLP